MESLVFPGVYDAKDSGVMILLKPQVYEVDFGNEDEHCEFMVRYSETF